MGVTSGSFSTPTSTSRFYPAAPRGATVHCKEAAPRRSTSFSSRHGWIPSRFSPPRPRPAPPRPAGRTISPPLELGGGSAGMAAGTGAPGGGGPGMDARLDQETARWLRWDKVKGAGGLGAPGGGAGPPARSPGAALPFLRRVPVQALPSFPPFRPAGPRWSRRKTEEEDAAAARPRRCGWFVAHLKFVQERLSRDKISHPAGGDCKLGSGAASGVGLNAAGLRGIA